MMSKRPVQLRIDESLLASIPDDINLSQLFRHLASLYVGQPIGVERENDLAGIIIDGLDARTHQLENKVWCQGQRLAPEEQEEVERLYEQALGITHPKCFRPRSIDLLKGQALLGRLALLRFESEMKEPSLRAI